MSNYFITPEIKDWKNKLEPFSFKIIAYDGNGRRIKNKQLYIKYAICSIGETIDLNTEENNINTVYANQDGVIGPILIGEEEPNPIKISMDLYMVDEYNEDIPIEEFASEYQCYHICDNLFIPFQPYIINFYAKYISKQKIAVNDKIPRKYIQITQEKSDDSIAIFTIENEIYDQYQLSIDHIQYAGDNIITISYYDYLLDKTWEYDIIVIGKVQELSIEGLYIGKEKQIENLIPKSEIIVTLTTFDGIQQETRQLKNDEWVFITFPQITNSNLGIFKIGRGNLKCEIKIPFRWIAYNYRLDAWYEGPYVRVGENFVPDNLRIWLYDDKGLRRLLKLEDCQIIPEEYVIHNVGNNWFTIKYRTGIWTVSDRIAIIGYTEKEIEQKDFEMMYFNPNTHSLEDVTNLFDETCKIAGKRYFNWEKILDTIKATFKFGKFRLHAPRLCGLSSRYTTEWIIDCDCKKAYENKINAYLNKTFYQKEEEENA